MIKETMEFLSATLRTGLGTGENDIDIGSLSLFKDKEKEGIVVSLLNIEEESTLKNHPHHFADSGTLFRQAPPLSINLSVVIAFNLSDYGATLRRLSEAANYFHKNRRFTREPNSEITLPETVGNLIMDMESLSLEQLNHVWSISGGIHYPALFYRVRLLQLKQDDKTEGKYIKDIELSGRSFTTPGEMKRHLNKEQQNGA